MAIIHQIVLCQVTAFVVLPTSLCFILFNSYGAVRARLENCFTPETNMMASKQLVLKPMKIQARCQYKI